MSEYQSLLVKMLNTMFLFLLLSIFDLDGIRSIKLRNNFKYITDQMAKRAQSQSNAEIKWIEQPLDHFDSNENRTFGMRYFEDRTFWQANGPIYLFIGGEGRGFAVSDGLLLYHIANETNGLVISSEHRYYGASKPHLDLSATENLKYLSSKQALADLAHLIRSIKLSPQFNASNSKVVVAGGSYAGNLAAWMKLLYPDLVYGAVASSAPVLAKKDFIDYIKKIGEDFKLYGGIDCYQKIQNKFSRWDQLFKTTEGIKQLKQEENICENNDITVPENKAYFFSIKSLPFCNAGQCDGPKYIHKMCSDIKKDSLSLGVTDSIKLTSNNCRNYSLTQYIESIKTTGDDFRYWLYQTCTEFGYFQTTGSNNQPFTNNIPLNFYLKQCSELFGPEFNEHRVDIGVTQSNKMYGELHPNVKNVLFVNGDVDPWSTLSILKDLSKDVPARVIKGTTHCGDIFSIRSSDSPDLIKAKKFVIYMVKEWLGLL